MTRPCAIEADVAEEDSVAAMVKAVVDRFGHLDGAVNNAGVAARSSPSADYTLDDWRHVMRVNLDGVFLCVREEIRAMREQRRRRDREHGLGARGRGLSGAGRLRHVQARADRPDARRPRSIMPATASASTPSDPAFILTPLVGEDDGRRRRSPRWRRSTLLDAGAGRRRSPR